MAAVSQSNIEGGCQAVCSRAAATAAEPEQSFRLLPDFFSVPKTLISEKPNFARSHFMTPIQGCSSVAEDVWT
jgi:hypothetical protein